MARWLPRSGTDLCVFLFIEAASASLELSSESEIGLLGEIRLLGGATGDAGVVAGVGAAGVVACVGADMVVGTGGAAAVDGGDAAVEDVGGAAADEDATGAAADDGRGAASETWADLSSLL